MLVWGKARGGRPFSSAKKGAKYVYLDYYLTTPIRTARKTINEARKRLNEGKTRLSDQKLDTINAIEAAFEEATANLLTSDFGETSFGDMMENVNTSPAFFLFLISAIVMAPFVEEVIFRGYFFTVLKKVKGKLFAVIASFLTCASKN